MSKKDKIFGNSFNESDYDGKSVNWKADSSYVEGKPIESTITSEILFREIHTLIENSEFKIFNIVNAETRRTPKLNKVDINKVYSYIVNEINGYDIIEIFVALFEYFDISKQKFYKSLNNNHQDRLQELLKTRSEEARKRLPNRLF